MNEVGVEQAINIANWDKQSTWESLKSKLNIKSWSEIRNGSKKKQK